MAITPVKTGNVTTPPPVKPADSKLTAQFNGAVKAGEKGSGPSTSTKPPFFTPHEGSFRDVRKIGGKAYNTRLKWTVNENQQSNTNKVFIRGTITVDYGNTKTSYAIDGNNSYINSDGSVIYQSNFISTTPYKTRYNIFSSVEKGVKAALKAVLNNKTYFNFNNSKTPVSMASAALTQALMPVGEVNLLNGIGLNGAGARIKNELNNQLSKTDTADDKVRIRQSIALAIRGAGVKIPVNGTIPEKLSKQSEPNTQAMADVEHLAATHMIETITNGERRRLGIHNRRMTEDDALTLAIAVNRIVTQPDNLRNYARHVANQLAERGVLFWDGVTVVDRETLVGVVHAAFTTRTMAPLNTYMEQAGVDQRRRPAVRLLVEDYRPAVFVYRYVNQHMAPLINNNVEEVAAIDNNVVNAIADPLLGIAASLMRWAANPG